MHGLVGRCIDLHLALALTDAATAASVCSTHEQAACSSLQETSLVAPFVDAVAALVAAVQQPEHIVTLLYYLYVWAGGHSVWAQGLPSGTNTVDCKSIAACGAFSACQQQLLHKPLGLLLE